MPRPTVLTFAGPNGSGKSTITKMIRPVGAYINADEIQRIRECSPLEAAVIAEKTREYCLSRNESFTFETVMSTERNVILLERAHAQGYYRNYHKNCNPSNASACGNATGDVSSYLYHYFQSRTNVDCQQRRHHVLAEYYD